MQKAQMILAFTHSFYVSVSQLLGSSSNRAARFVEAAHPLQIQECFCDINRLGLLPEGCSEEAGLLLRTATVLVVS